ncbi:helix-turn-helix domain-containing protein [Streptomyces lydicus]|uniref:helix-turn-helix domain-containing protein n=1 Tax=Streptomyces lydicus TaxID=47763 RepID=UPI0033F95840
MWKRFVIILEFELEDVPSQGASKIDVYTTKPLLVGLLEGYRTLRGHTDGSPTPRQLSQERLARLSGMSLPWYRKLEKSERRGNVTELDRIARLLQMTSRARIALFRRSAGHDPLPFASACTPGELPALWRLATEVQPTCTVDPSFDIWHHNGRFASRFPSAAASARRPNLMEMLLLQPESRRQLDSWSQWAHLLTAELAEAVALYGEANATLHRLHSLMAADETVGPVYRTAAAYLFPDADCKVALIESSPRAGLRQLTLLGI